MKATGIVRRIDDLGRVVIPKEIRRTMRIREGDPLEIYTANGGEVIFKKYSPMGEMAGFATEYADALSLDTKLAVIICDRDRCIAASNISKKDVLEKRISPELEEIMENRRRAVFEGEKSVIALEDVENQICVAVPIVTAGDISGAVVLLATNEQRTSNESDVKLANVAAKFLSNQMD